ncbi:MAG: efflux RND transporter permease subunit [Gemmatimonadales bacterium]|nr:efflux RND transporter permease subunit [Gemmatimonadales bacterium]MDZ4390850.1 efflux RND transporter permease subunit [Gemmatimonadales bacterium]
MWISDFAIKRPLLTVVAMLSLVAFGVAALVNLQTDEFPDLAQPIISVAIPYPGASPDIVEREVVVPVEEAIFALSGVDRTKTKSNSVDGLAQFTIFFDFKKGVAEAAQDVRDALGTIRGDLPTESEDPIITRFDPTEQSILSLTVTSELLDARALTRLADPVVVSAIRSVPGVAQATVLGGIYPELTVELRPAAMQAAGVGIDEVVNALSNQNLAVPVGRLNTALEERAIRLKGRLDDAAAFRQIVVAQRGSRQVRLGDIAEVREGSEEPRTAAAFNGRAAVGIEVKKSKGYSTTQVVDRLKAELARVQATLPGDAKVEIVRDGGYRVERAVANVQEALIEGAFLTVLVVFLFLNSWRSTVITGLALPVSVLASFIAVWAFGFTLNTMSLLGLSLAIGILIDDAIVVRENIVRHVEMGKDHYTAAREGTAEIGLAVAATTFSIVAVFIPIAFMAGISGQWFKPFALTIACSVLVSLLVSFSLDPMLSAYWPDPHREEHEKGIVTRILDRFNHWFDRQTDNYARLIGWALDHRFAVMTLAIGSFAGAIVLQSTFGGAGFVPPSDRSEMDAIIEGPPSANLEFTRERAEAVAAIARRHPEVQYTYVTVGNALPMRTPGVDQAQVYIKLVPKAERRISQAELGGILREEFAQVGGVQVSVFTGGFAGAQKEIQLELRGPDAAVLTVLAEEAVERTRKVPGAVDVGLSVRGVREELTVTLDRGLASSLGLTVGQVAQAMRPAFAGIDAGDWVDPVGETRDVRVRLAPEARSRAIDLAQLPISIRNADGGVTLVPLGQVARVAVEDAPGQIDHLDRETVVTLGANLQGHPLGEVQSAIQAELAAMVFPPGYQIMVGGQGRDQAEVFRNVFTALGIAVLMMYLILVVQFGSFLDPLAILVSLPLSLIGVVLALLATGDTLNIMSLIGVILLMGLVAKNAILLIDFAKWSREERGTPLRESLIEAGRIRLRPILMTTFALIAGMVPVALGGGEGADFRAPLGRAVIGGVLSSAVLTLIVIPTVYEILDEWRSGVLRLVRRK